MIKYLLMFLHEMKPLGIGTCCCNAPLVSSKKEFLRITLTLPIIFIKCST